MPTFTERIQHAWNAFMNRDPTVSNNFNASYVTGYRPDRVRLTRGNERSIITAIYNRIAIDVSSVDIKHVRLDEEERYLETIKSGLTEALTVSANIDQTGRDLVRDIVLSLFDEGCVAVVPVDTTLNPLISGSYDIQSLRTGKVTRWYPEYVTINLYNQHTGRREDITLPKKVVAIIENPLYAVMNEPNSTLQRLIRKLNQLDYIDEQSTSGKLDLIIQLPYIVKSEARRKQAEQRRKDIEMQLAGSKYGIAYTDGTERITQLNRAVENNMWQEIKDLTQMLYNQLGMTEAILDGTADEKARLNYMETTVKPVLNAIVDEMARKFLTKTARTQGQTVMYFSDPFSLVPVSDIAEIADKFTRNEILTPNEIRQIIGRKPSDDPQADKLRNRNINQSDEAMMQEQGMMPEMGEEDDSADYDEQIAQLDEVEGSLDDLEKYLQ